MGTATILQLLQLMPKSSPDKAKWEKAMEREMASLRVNDVWELVELPSNWKIIKSEDFW